MKRFTVFGNSLARSPPPVKPSSPIANYREDEYWNSALGLLKFKYVGHKR